MESCSTSTGEQQDDTIFGPSISPVHILPTGPIATSTPRRVLTTCSRVDTNTQPLTLPQENSNKFETVVKVSVIWNSKTSTKVLPEDLNSLGKMMCRGTYTQIARAAWRNGKIREQLMTLLLKEVDKECCNMCSSKNPSILRKTAKKFFF